MRIFTVQIERDQMSMDPYYGRMPEGKFLDVDYYTSLEAAHAELVRRGFECVAQAEPEANSKGRYVRKPDPAFAAMWGGKSGPEEAGLGWIDTRD